LTHELNWSVMKKVLGLRAPRAMYGPREEKGRKLHQTIGGNKKVRGSAVDLFHEGRHEPHRFHDPLNWEPEEMEANLYLGHEYAKNEAGGKCWHG